MSYEISIWYNHSILAKIRDPGSNGASQARYDGKTGSKTNWRAFSTRARPSTKSKIAQDHGQNFS